MAEKSIFSTGPDLWKNRQNRRILDFLQNQFFRSRILREIECTQPQILIPLRLKVMAQFVLSEGQNPAQSSMKHKNAHNFVNFGPFWTRLVPFDAKLQNAPFLSLQHCKIPAGKNVMGQKLFFRVAGVNLCRPGQIFFLPQ